MLNQLSGHKNKIFRRLVCAVSTNMAQTDSLMDPVQYTSSSVLILSQCVSGGIRHLHISQRKQSDGSVNLKHQYHRRTKSETGQTVSEWRQRRLVLFRGSNHQTQHVA